MCSIFNPSFDSKWLSIDSRCILRSVLRPPGMLNALVLLEFVWPPGPAPALNNYPLDKTLN